MLVAAVKVIASRARIGVVGENRGTVTSYRKPQLRTVRFRPKPVRDCGTFRSQFTFAAPTRFPNTLILFGRNQRSVHYLRDIDIRRLSMFRVS
jgi:hypothetical protein